MDPRTILQLAHLLVLGPMLIAIGLGYGPATAIAGLGIFIILYHAYKAYVRYSAGQIPWVNLIHMLIVGPALVAKGFVTERYLNELILMLGFAAIGYHGYYLIAK